MTSRGTEIAGLAVYNPDLLTREEINEQFVVRRKLLDRLLDDLRRTEPGTAPQHHLLVGQRGMGKTTILRRLRHAIEDDADLAKHWMPLTFPEEQYNVAGLADLWTNCLDALSDSLEESGSLEAARELDQAIKELPADELERTARAFRLLDEWSRRHGRGLVLLLDNIDLVLERLAESHWDLREAMSSDARLAIIGATSHAIEATFQYEGAFYDFFKVHELRGLTEDEARALLLKLADLRKTPHVAELLRTDPGRFKALHLLTGGNPRTLVLLYQVLAEDEGAGVPANLERLLDHSTPLYKARFEEFAPQAQQVVDALAVNWNPMTAQELAGKTRLDVNAVSSQLARLAAAGVVEKVPYPPGRRTGFQVAERFFNIWYLMRASRRVRRRLAWLVEFLRLFYGADELRRRAHGLLGATAPRDDPGRARRAELAFAMADCVAEPALAGPDAEKLARRAHVSAPDDPVAAVTLAVVLARCDAWPEATSLVPLFTRDAPPHFVEAAWHDIMRFFEEAVAQGHARDAADLLERLDMAERWRPLHEALLVHADGSDDRLARIAPEMRKPATEMLEGFRVFAAARNPTAEAPSQESGRRAAGRGKARPRHAPASLASPRRRPKQ